MGIEKKDPANFSPSVEIPAKVDSFRFWCQKVLPLVYDDSLSYYELLCKVVDYLNNTIADVNTLGTDIDNINKAYNELQSYVNDYFSTLDVQDEINNKLDTMASDGTLFSIFSPLITSISQPKVVNSISEMVHTEYTYVLSDNGHIYQYDNGWKDSGLIYATDISNYLGLKSPVVTDLNNIISAGIYFHGTSDSPATNTPDDSVYGNTGFMIISYYQNETRNYQMFYGYDTNTFFIRHQKIRGWTNWTSINITGGDLPNNDLDNILVTGSFFHGSSDSPATNTPDDSVYGNAGFMIISYYQNEARNYQMFYGYDTNTFFIRHQKIRGWTNWTRIVSDTKKISISKTNDTNYKINFGKYTTNLWHNINTNINADLWNLSYIKYNDIEVIPRGTDIIGPIKEINQNDFMGGVHGDEKTTSLYITIDGVEWDYETEITGEVIEIIMTSELYRVSDKTHVYNRHVKLTITYNKITVENMYTCLVDDSTIERATNGGLIAVQNTILKAVEMNNFFSSTPPISKVSNSSKNNIGGTLFWENGSISVENIIGKEQESYSGYLQVFTNEIPMRNKIYLDVISSNKKIENGENILGKFEITLA